MKETVILTRNLPHALKKAKKVSKHFSVIDLKKWSITSNSSTLIRFFTPTRQLSNIAILIKGTAKLTNKYGR